MKINCFCLAFTLLLIFSSACGDEAHDLARSDERSDAGVDLNSNPDAGRGDDGSPVDNLGTIACYSDQECLASAEIEIFWARPESVYCDNPGTTDAQCRECEEPADCPYGHICQGDRYCSEVACDPDAPLACGALEGFTCSREFEVCAHPSQTLPGE